MLEMLPQAGRERPMKHPLPTIIMIDESADVA
jgi:hypothetical protein